MIAPEDKRHGTNAGYIAGCREDCCREGHAKYKRDRRTRTYLARGPLTVPAIGFQRRVQGLMFLGYTMEEISTALGHHRSWCHQTVRHDVIFRDTHVAMDKLYRRWCMTLPPEKPIRARTRNLARNRGYSAPLAWDEGDLDNPDARPYDYVEPTPEPKPTKPQRKRRNDVDESVVLAVLSGERRDTTPGEKQEIGRRWRAMGKPMAELARVTGWTKVERYGRHAA